MTTHRLCCAFLSLLIVASCRGRESSSGLQEESRPAEAEFSTQYQVSSTDVASDLKAIQELMAKDGRSWSTDLLLKAYSPGGVFFTTVKMGEKPVAVIAWSVNRKSKDPSTGKVEAFIEIQEFSVDPYLESKHEEPLLRYLTGVMETIRTDESINRLSVDLPILFKCLYAYKEKFSRLKAIGFQSIERIGETAMPTLERSGEAGGYNYEREGIIASGLSISKREAILRTFGARSELTLSLRQGTSIGSDPNSLAIVSEFAKDLRRLYLQRPDLFADKQVLEQAPEETALTMSILEGGAKSLAIFGAKGEGKTYFSQNFLAALVRDGFSREDEFAKAMLDSLGESYLLFEMSGTSIRGGTEYHGQFDKRLQALKNLSGNGQRRVILFCDEVHALLKDVEILDSIKTELAEGWLQIIGTSTWAELRQTAVVNNDAGTDRFILWEMESYQKSIIIDIIKGVHEKKVAKGRGIKTTLSSDALAAAVYDLSRVLIPNAGRVRGPIRAIYPQLSFLSKRTPFHSVEDLERALLTYYRAQPDAFFPMAPERLKERLADLKQRLEREAGPKVSAADTDALLEALTVSLTQDTGNSNLLTLESQSGVERADLAQSIAKALSRGFTVFDAQLVARGTESFDAFMHDYLVKNEMRGGTLSIIYLENLAKISPDARSKLLEKVKSAEIAFQTPLGNVNEKKFPSMLFVAADKAGEEAVISPVFFNRVSLIGVPAKEVDRFESLVERLKSAKPDLVKAFNEEHLGAVKSLLEKKLGPEVPDSVALIRLTTQMTSYASQNALLGPCEVVLQKTAP